MPRWKALGEGWSKRTETEDRCDVAVVTLSSDVRDVLDVLEGSAFRTGDGGRVGTDVVVVTVVTVPAAFCLESVEAWRAYFSRFARFWFALRCEGFPRLAKDIAVDSEPCCFDLSMIEPLLTGSFSSLTERSSRRASSVFAAAIVD